MSGLSKEDTYANLVESRRRFRPVEQAREYIPFYCFETTTLFLTSFPFCFNAIFISVSLQYDDIVMLAANPRDHI